MSASSRRSRKGALARKLALAVAAAVLITTGLTVVLVHGTLAAAVPQGNGDTLNRGWLLGGIMMLVATAVVGLIAYVQGSGLGTRLTDLGIAVAKIGRGTSEVRVRVSGNDEVMQLGRALQYLATDMMEMAREAEKGGSLAPSMDPLVREMRDKALPQQLPRLEGWELDGVLTPGTRGGMEWFDCVVQQDGAVLMLISPEGTGSMAALAARMARDEVLRALKADATPRKALAHANRVMHRELPKGVCAKAALLAVAPEQAKLYQADYHTPLWAFRAGRREDVHAEGLALGLDEGPVFEKSLRSTTVPVAQGSRFVLVNAAAARMDEVAELTLQHAPKNTAAFMNMVLGALEQTAGEAGLREDVVLLTAKRW